VLDSLDMFGAARGLADQVERAATSALAVSGLPDRAGISNVVVLGMGGSGIGGDILGAVAGPSCPVPIVVAKGYDAPAFVGPDSLVVASSFSGNTEETIAAAVQAHHAGARLLVLAHGGELERLAADWDVPHLPVQDGLPMPRAGIGAVSIPLLIVLERLGLASGLEAQVQATVDQLRRRIEELSAHGSAAATLARRIGRTMPIVYGSAGIGEIAALRWKGQFNENPKIPSFTNRVPELTHNEICGWGQHGDVTRQVFSLIQLRHDHEHPRNAARLGIVAEICDEIVADVHEVRAEGQGPLAQLFDLIVYGDFVTLELAVQSGVDPGPIPILDGIKASMRQV